MSEKPSRQKPPNAGKGRVKGVPNKATADVRAAVASIAQGRAKDVNRWLTQCATGIRERGTKQKPGAWLVKPDPGRAAQIYFGAIEYHIPKLSRTELSTGSDTLRIEIVDPTKRDRPAS